MSLSLSQTAPKVGRNDRCPCGSGKKHKKCCGDPLKTQQGGGGPMLGAALAYAQRLGWPVFPCCWITEAGACSCGRPDCGSPGKHPLTGQGFKEASRDEAQIRRWWTRWPAANIGVPAGQASGFDVLDVDPRHGGEEGLAELELVRGKLPATIEAITGGGGRHILFRHQEGISNKAGFLPGLDVRGEGGYIVVAPSRHASGRLYQWELSSRPNEVELAEWPAWALELVRKPAREEKATPPPTPREGQSTAYGRAALEGEAEKVRHALPGQQETTLNEAAFSLGTLVAAGVLEYQEALAGLVEAGGQMRSAEDRAPWTMEQVRKKAEHGLADGMQHPRREDNDNGQGRVRQAPTSNEGPVSFVSAPGEELGREEWPELQPLPDSLPAVEPFEFGLLPEAFRLWIEDIAERMQCPPDYLGIGALVALGAAVGRQVGIHPKRQDDWLVVPNLWGAAIGPPSLMKSPALQEILGALHRLESQARESHEQALFLYEADQVVAEAKKKNAQGELRKAITAGRDAQELALACVSGTETPPARRRYVVNDSTVEKLGEILSANPRGVLLFRDELIGFLKTLEREGHEADRAFYLEAWNGTGRFTYDRIGRGTVEIEAACISILGGIQPGPLGAYVRGAAQGKGGDDGLIQRFQLAVFPDLPATWVNHDRMPHLAARSRASAVFERLDTLTPAAVGAELPDPRFGGVPFLRFTPAAQEIFTEWRTELEHRLRRGEEPPILEAHLAKYRSLVPSLALLIHLADEGVGPVGEEALKRACAWAEYLESHARRIYSPAIAPATATAKTLADRILKGDLKGPFTVREVYRNQWRGLTDREEVTQGLDLLEALGWVRGQEERSSGRPTVSYQINPGVSPQEASNG